MTGGEIVVGRALLGAGKKALEEDESSKKQLQRIGEGSPAMKMAADTYARRVAVKQEILLRLFKPLALVLGVSRDYFATDFARDMAEKIADIPEENLTSPAPSVAVPAMEGLRYSLDDPDLKEMYLNLLAAATDNRRTGQAHPSFAEVIKQLAAEEARLLTSVLKLSEIPIVRIKGTVSTGGFVILQDHVVDWRNSGLAVEVASSAVFIDNWRRLGLVNPSYAEHFTDENRYDWVVERPEYVRLSALLAAANPPTPSDFAANPAAAPSQTIGFDKGILYRTAFGERFASAVSISSTVLEAEAS